jgi:hypothetical protein
MYMRIKLCDAGRSGNPPFCQYIAHWLDRTALTHLFGSLYTCIHRSILMSQGESRLLYGIVGVAQDNFTHIIQTVWPVIVTEVRADIFPFARLLYSQPESGDAA